MSFESFELRALSCERWEFYGVDYTVDVRYRKSDQAIGGNSSNPAFLFYRGEPILVGLLSFEGSPAKPPFTPALFGSGTFLGSESISRDLDLAIHTLGGSGKINYITLKP
ncbi:MAG: hypothetical protein ACSHYF_10800 [Verrucomicrobiaceae bacterium]